MSGKRETRIMTLLAETFLHPGTGQSTGIVDLPVQRERHTNFPMIQSSGIKGCLRDLAEQKWQGSGGNKIIETIFGPDTENADTGAGALAVTDARILAFPVRSLQQVFVWVTCPMALTRLKRDIRLAGLSYNIVIPEVNEVSKDVCKVFPKSDLDSPLVLEELSFLNVEKTLDSNFGKNIAKLCPDIGEEIKKRLVLISNEDFTYFVTYATQVSARIRLNKNKTTTGGDGNLWYEETLPPETILYSLLLANPPRNKSSEVKGCSDVINKIAGNGNALFSQGKGYLQVGGNETVGQGWCSVKISKGDAQ